MSITAERSLRRFALVAAAMLILCICPHIGMSGEPTFVVRLMNGQDRSYAIDAVQRVDFGPDTLRVVAMGRTDSYEMESIVRVRFLWDEWTAIDHPEDASVSVSAMHLFPNQPNPFSPETRIAFELPEAGHTELRIYAACGRLISTLVKEHRGAGPHSVFWNGRDQAGRKMPSGVYFYSLAAPGVKESRKMVLLR